MTPELLEDSIFDPAVPPQNLTGARTLVLNGIMQSNLDARGFQIVNLDTSNLVIDPIPSQHAPAHQWYNRYDQGTNHLGAAQPLFSDIGGNLTLPQQSAITRVGTVTRGAWASTDGPIDGVYLPTLDQIRPPIAFISANQHRLGDLKDPEAPQDAVNLRTMQVMTMGFQPKSACICSTTVNSSLFGLTVPVDGVPLSEGTRVLVRSQTDSTQNGIYDAHAGAWTRSADANTGAELVGAMAWVGNGTLHANDTFIQATVDPITLGVSPIFFVHFSTVTPPSAGDGLTQDADVISAVGTLNRILIGTGIDIAPNYVGQASITTLGTVTTGTWKGVVIDGQYGGTGVSNLNRTLTLRGNLATTILLPDFTPEAPDVGIGSTIHLQCVGSCTVVLPATGTLATTGGNETFTNKHISADQVDTGVFPVLRGGTGAADPNLALNNLLPLQTGNAGKTLKTDGTNVFWG